jgi:hypothetical protein
MIVRAAAKASASAQGLRSAKVLAGTATRGPSGVVLRGAARGLGLRGLDAMDKAGLHSAGSSGGLAKPADGPLSAALQPARRRPIFDRWRENRFWASPTVWAAGPGGDALLAAARDGPPARRAPAAHPVRR